MDIKQLAKKIDGIHTVETIQNQLNISRRTAINYISRLRNAGYVHTKRGAAKKRVYDISPMNKQLEGNPGLYETINNYSKIKISSPYKTFVHGRKLSVEDALVGAISSGDYRVIIAAIPLFNHIKNWGLLSKLAKKENIQSKVGALYDVARTIVKTRKMDERTRNNLKGSGKPDCLIKGLVKEKDFAEIGQKWNVIIGLTKKDLLRLKE